MTLMQRSPRMENINSFIDFTIKKTYARYNKEGGEGGRGNGLFEGSNYASISYYLFNIMETICELRKKKNRKKAKLKPAEQSNDADK